MYFFKAVSEYSFWYAYGILFGKNFISMKKEVYNFIKVNLLIKFSKLELWKLQIVFNFFLTIDTDD